MPTLEGEGFDARMTTIRNVLYGATRDRAFGKFRKEIKNGAHYIEPKDNAFKGDGILCGNCVFFGISSPNTCEIVEKEIDSDAVCRFWIIPPEQLKE